MLIGQRLIFPALICLLAAILMRSHCRAIRLVNSSEGDVHDQRFRRRQFNRRMIASGSLFVVGVGIGVGTIISRQDYPLAFVLVWCSVLLLTLWIMLLALADHIDTRMNVSNLRHQQDLESKHLMALLQKNPDWSAKSNGPSNSNSELRNDASTPHIDPAD